MALTGTAERWDAGDIPDQSGRVALVTGANSGLGLETARELARAGAHVVLACRNADRAEQARADIRASGAGDTEALALDLADLDAVRDAAEAFRQQHDQLDLLVNNAGVMGVPRTETAQGFELQIGVNHLGHFALTGHLVDLVVAAEAGRVVTVSSLGHVPGRIRFDDLNWQRRYSPWEAYFQSKLANLLFTQQLQRRLTAAGVDAIAAAAHPGMSSSNLGYSGDGIVGKAMRLARPVIEATFVQSTEMGALPILRAATDPDARPGDYFGPGGPTQQRGHPRRVDMRSSARDPEAGRRLWELSRELTGVDYPI